MNYKQAYKPSQTSYNKVSQGMNSPGKLFDNKIANQLVDENDKWLCTKNASTYLGITPNALRILVHKGKVDAFKLGTHLRFDPNDLKMLLIKKEH
ncbi:MAG: helix-turn-helix domain-containing protein [Bacteriovoracaceae bacterium]|nr:helix-turn-helix domain-containing protein [Bacteriovoracaceae bacterium]